MLLNHEVGIDNLNINPNAQHSFSDIITPFKGVLLSYKPMPRMQFMVVEQRDNFDLFRVASVKFTPNLVFALDSPANPYNIKQTLQRLDLWLKRDLTYYIEEVNTPDLLAEYKLRQNASDITTIDYEDKSNFTIKEKESIKIALLELKALITDRFDADETQQQILAHHLLYLTERVEVLNKTDWKGILINTIIGISIALSLDSQKGAALMQLVIQVFQFSPGLLTYH